MEVVMKTGNEKARVSKWRCRFAGNIVMSLMGDPVDGSNVWKWDACLWEQGELCLHYRHSQSIIVGERVYDSRFPFWCKTCKNCAFYLFSPAQLLSGSETRIDGRQKEMTLLIPSPCRLHWPDVWDWDTGKVTPTHAAVFDGMRWCWLWERFQILLLCFAWRRINSELPFSRSYLLSFYLEGRKQKFTVALIDEKKVLWQLLLLRNLCFSSRKQRIEKRKSC